MSNVIEIETEEGICDLHPTFDACIALNSGGIGLVELVDRCRRFDYEAICAILEIGIGDRSAALRIVRRMGTFELSGPCIEFLHAIGNSGRVNAPE